MSVYERYTYWTRKHYFIVFYHQNSITRDVLDDFWMISEHLFLGTLFNCFSICFHWKWSTLREKCPYFGDFLSVFSRIRTRKAPNTETFQAVPLIVAFLVHIFMYSDQEKLRIWTLFTQCYIFKLLTVSKWSIKANTYSCSKKGLYHWLLLEFSQCLGEVISFGKYLADSFCQSKHLENINSEKGSRIKNNLSSKTLKNGQTYFKSLEVFTIQDFLSMFDHSSTLCLKGFSSFE